MLNGEINISQCLWATLKLKTAFKKKKRPVFLSPCFLPYLFCWPLNGSDGIKMFA